MFQLGIIRYIFDAGERRAFHGSGHHEGASTLGFIISIRYQFDSIPRSVLFDLSLVISAVRSLTHDRAFAMCLAMVMQASGNYNACFSGRRLTDVTRPTKSSPGPGLTSLWGSLVRPCLGTLDTTPPYRFWSLGEEPRSAKSEERWGLCELGLFL